MQDSTVLPGLRMPATGRLLSHEEIDPRWVERLRHEGLRKKPPEMSQPVIIFVRNCYAQIVDNRGKAGIIDQIKTAMETLPASLALIIVIVLGVLILIESPFRVGRLSKVLVRRKIKK